ncbi:hypothetical protein HYX16_03940 [Candidatus Woesearchaeota archaeon]|nr:hypothetical protein [Candidatus Woesearchaeota archaeon]
MDKKGVEITFNWIFVAVAGAILLMFFIYFAWKQIDLFNTLGINEVVLGVDNEINAFSVSGSSNKIVQIPSGVSFKFSCGEVLYKNAKKDTLRLIYGDNVLRDNYVLWTRSWNFPFFIDNLYYTSKDNKNFYVIGNNNFLFNIPGKFKKSEQAPNEAEKSSVIVDFTNSGFEKRFPETKVLAVDKANNIVTFYPENKKEEFYGEEMLYGAMFTNFDDYKCLKEKSLARISIIADLYKKKAELLKSGSKCSFNYDKLKEALDLFKENPIRYKDVLTEQDETIKRNGCPGVF